MSLLVMKRPSCKPRLSRAAAKRLTRAWRPLLRTPSVASLRQPFILAGATVAIVSLATSLVFIALLYDPFTPAPPRLPHTVRLSAATRPHQPHTAFSIVHGDGRTARSPIGSAISAVRSDADVVESAILMSCPVGPSDTHRGAWKPTNMAHGAETVVRRLAHLNSTLPFFFAYYAHEKVAASAFCHTLIAAYSHAFPIHCLPVPDRFPAGQYGYAKIFAIRRVPVRQVLWLDCDVYPLRDLAPLFNDAHYRSTGAMFWPDSRDFFDEFALEPVLRSPTMRRLFPLDAWWVRQGFDSGIILINRTASGRQLRTLCAVARAQRYEALRSISMGDKDLFHIAWMMHKTNFTMVPFAGEAGQLETTAPSARRAGMKRVWHEPQPRLRWRLTSQIKFGRDGLAYALHQLHRRQPPEKGKRLHQKRHGRVPKHHGMSAPALAGVGDGGGVGKGVADARRWFVRRGVGEYVQPEVAARMDLRVLQGEASGDRRKMGEFVEAVESVLVSKDGLGRRAWREARLRAGARGIRVCDGRREFGDAVSEMDRAWRGGDGKGGPMSVNKVAAEAVRRFFEWERLRAKTENQSRGSDGGGAKVRIVAPQVAGVGDGAAR